MKSNRAKKYYVILTNDYEIFGDGSGNVEDILISPTEDLLKLCGNYGVPMTLFFEVLEYFAFREAEDTKIFGDDYKPAALIENQLKEAKIEGHDIQLHFHPQWIGAKPVSHDKWTINPRYWRLPLVPGGLGYANDPESIMGLFFKGKNFLENLLKPIDPKYECIAFRAGGYCIQPEKEVLKAMMETGLLVDSSVCPGKIADKGSAMFDFSNAPYEKPYWRIDDSVTIPQHSGQLLEIPIVTRNRSRLSNFENLSKKKGKELLRAFKRLFWPPITNFDFCKLTLKEMKYFLISYIKKFENYPGPVPIVITGHSKEYKGDSELINFLHWAQNIDQVHFSTYKNFVNLVVNSEDI